MVTDCVVVPRGTQPRVGHLVLTRLDLDFDYDRETVVPRCPDYPLLRICGNGKQKRTPHHFASSIFVFSSFCCRHVSIRRFGHVTCPSQLLGW